MNINRRLKSSFLPTFSPPEVKTISRRTRKGGKSEGVRQEITPPTFSLLERGPLYRLCSFIPYSAVESMSNIPHLEHMSSGSIVDHYAEEFVEDDEL
jgi:hypothetical protein